MARGLATVAAVTVVLVTAAVAGAAVRGAAAINACSLISAVQARSVLGYQVRVQKGETIANCVLVSTPVKLDPTTMKPRRPTVGFELYVEGSRPGTFSSLIAGARTPNAKVTRVTGLGSSAYIVSSRSKNPYIVGQYVLLAKVGKTILDLSVGPGATPISQAQGVKLAKLIAARL